MRQHLAMLRGFFAYLYDKFCLLASCIKNKIACFFDPKARDFHSIIISILILFALMPVFVFLLVIIFSCKIIFMPILQLILYIRRAILVAKLVKFVGRYLKHLNFRIFPGTSLAMLKVKALGSLHGADFYVTRMPAVKRDKFFRKYLNDYMLELDSLEPGVLSPEDKARVTTRAMKYVGHGLDDHYNVSFKVPGDPSGNSLFVGSALTSKRPPTNLAELNMLIKGEIININPQTVINFERIEEATRDKAQFLVSNIFNISDSTMIEVVDLSDKKFNPMFYKNESNVEGIACVLEPAVPLVKSLSGVRDCESITRIAKDAQNELFPANAMGISSAVIVPFI